MKIIGRIIISFVLLSQAVSFSFAQGETAVPFLLVTSSVEGNGMGGIAGSVITNNALSIIPNPGQIGLLSLENYFTGSLYTRKTAWLPQFEVPDLTYNSRAAVAGLNLARLIEMPIAISFGIGYSTVDFNLGRFAITRNDPNIIEYFDAYENAKGYTIGIGVEYIAKFGIGYTSRKIISHILAFSNPDSAESRPQAADFGIFLQAPIPDLIQEFGGPSMNLSTHTKFALNLVASYTRTNVGDDVVYYIDPAQNDPLPRQVGIGLSLEPGFVFEAPNIQWKVFSLTFAREAQDILVERFPNGNWRYVSGFGALRFFNNLILGEWGGKVILRKGWQVNLGEIVYVRGGSVVMRGLEHSTQGMGLRISGLFKALQFLDPEIADNPTFRFIVDHIDLQYDQSSYNETTSPISGTTFLGLTVILK